MGTQTATLRFTKPTINADGGGLWPAELNLNCDLLDRAVNQVVTVSVPDTNVILTADGTNSDQALYAVYNFTGALTADRTITLPASVKIGYAINNTTGGHNVILSAGGTTLALNDANWNFFYCDGSNVVTPSIGVGAIGVGSGTAAIGATANNGISLTGTAGNDTASAGQVGEVISSVVLESGGIACGNGVAGNVTSISLTAGDWDVWGNVGLQISGGNASLAQGWISTTSAVIPASPNNGAQSLIAFGAATMTGALLPVGMTPLHLASTTTVYLSVFGSFTGSAVCYGFIG